MTDALWDKNHYGRRPYSSENILSTDVRIVQDMTPENRLTRDFNAGVEIVVDSIMGSWFQDSIFGTGEFCIP